jgi:hypothetical protein
MKFEPFVSRPLNPTPAGDPWKYPLGWDLGGVHVPIEIGSYTFLFKDHQHLPIFGTVSKRQLQKKLTRKPVN